ncbi:MAG: Transcriptional regulator, partial [uncultured Acidimicrobiales bacterium]
EPPGFCSRGRPVDAAHPLPPRRGLPAGEAAGRQPGGVPRRAGGAAEGPGCGHPPCPAQPGRRQPAPAVAAAFGHEAHHRHGQPGGAPASHAATRQPPAGHRDRPRHGGGRRRRRRRADRGPRAAPAHDRARAAPHPGRPDLRLLRPAWPPDPARRRGPRQPGARRSDGAGRARRAEQAGRHQRPVDLREREPRGHGRRPQVDDDRHLVVPEPQAPPQRHRHAAQPVVHGPAQLGAAQLYVAHGPAAGRSGEDLPDRDHPQHRHLSQPVLLPAEAGVGVVGPRPGRVPGHVEEPRPGASPHGPQHLPRHEVTAADDERPGRRGRGRPPAHPCQPAPPAPRAGGGTGRRAHHGPAVPRPLQRQLHPQPAAGHVPRARLLLQPVPRQAAGAEGWRGHPEPPHPLGVPPRPPPQLHRLLRAGAGRDHRPPRDREEVRRGLRHRSLVHPPVPQQLRLPRRSRLLHVVLGRARPPARRPGHHRGRRAAGRAPLGLQARVHAPRRPGDGRGRGRPQPVDHPHPQPPDLPGRRHV